MAGLCLTGILAIVLSGCDRESTPDESSGAGSKSAAVTPKSPEADAALKRMVSGVSATKDDSLVELKFELQARPQIGQSLPIEVALVPKKSAASMQVTYISADALTLEPVKVAGEFRNVQAGNIYHHQVSVIPRDSGVYYVSAVVMLDGQETGNVTRTFAIPVLVGAPETPGSEGKDAAH
ncbi:MAG TPA: hypothetical protein VKB41_05880 [Steroidobacteraceae bacterium]|jgi:hypothetical protein|nr:hypothetical protein [Steroidobacteraceae bacterium]